MLCNIKLRHKLCVLLLLSCLAVLGVAMGALSLSWDVRLAERQDKLKAMVTAADGALEILQRRLEAERATPDDALQQAREMIWTMSEGEEDPLFMIALDGTALVVPSVEYGTANLYDLRDSEGRSFIREEIETALGGGGFVRYSIPRPGTATPAEKISYVTMTPDGGALVGAGVFVDDLRREFWRTALLFLGAIAAIFVVTLGLSGRIVRSILSPLGGLLQAMDQLSRGQTAIQIEGLDRRDEAGDVARGIHSWREHTLRREQLQSQVDSARKELLHKATHDDVTGLPNARHAIEVIGNRLRSGAGIAVIVISVQDLHHVAARHGDAGQRHLLCVLASRLRGCCGAGDLVTRIDTDEFAVVTGIADHMELASRLRAAVDAPVAWGSLILDAVPALGLARSSDMKGGGEELLQAGITACRSSAGRDIVIYTDALRARLEREIRLETRLRMAVERSQISLALQPKMDAVTGRLIGAEALARWHDEELGGIAPFEFIPLAERMGIIGDLDDILLRRSLKEAARWNEAGFDFTVAVNVSALELRSGDLVGRFAAALSASAVDPSQLVVELTESAVAENPKDAARQLSALKDLGVSLSLDDFGTGYSSLSHLRRFPLDTLKIDRSFVVDLPKDHDAAAVAQTIVALAASLGMETVAEGVETEEQARFLTELGVTTLQGYLYGRPMPPDMFMALAEAQRERPEPAVSVFLPAVLTA